MISKELSKQPKLYTILYIMLYMLYCIKLYYIVLLLLLLP